MLERGSHFNGLIAPGKSGGAGAANVTLGELRPAAFIELLELPGVSSAMRARALGALAPGIAALAIGETILGTTMTVGRIAPRRIVVIGSPPPPELQAVLGEAFAIIDDSHGRAGIRVSGASADVLGKGFSFDLSIRAFPVGRIAQAKGFGMALTLMRRAEGAFDVYCAASYAQNLAEALTDAALEFGWRADGAIA